MSIEHLHLASTNSGTNITHAVIVANSFAFLEIQNEWRFIFGPH